MFLQTDLKKTVNTVESADQKWFLAKDIFEMLDLSWRGADSLWQRQTPKEWALLLSYETNGGMQKGWFINKDCISKLILKSVKQSKELEDIALELGIYVEKIWIRNEVEFIRILQAILTGSGSEDIIETQFSIGKYRLDGYIKRYNLVIEYDEKTHAYKKQDDLEREKIIKDALSIERNGVLIPPYFFRIEMGKEYEAIETFTSFIFKQEKF
jgi:hypothetical protein